MSRVVRTTPPRRGGSVQYSEKQLPKNQFSQEVLLRSVVVVTSFHTGTSELLLSVDNRSSPFFSDKFEEWAGAKKNPEFSGVFAFSDNG